MGSIIRVQFSGWQLFGGTYQYSIILRGNSFSANCPGANYLGDNFQSSNLWGVIIQGAIILEGSCSGGNSPGTIILGGNCPGGNYTGDNYPGGNCSVPILVIQQKLITRIYQINC